MMRLFYRRLRLLRFDVVMAVLAGVSGLVGLLKILPPTDPLAVRIGNWQVAFDAILLLAGVGMFAGIGAAYRSLHLGAVVLLATSFLVRFVVLVNFFAVVEPRRVVVSLVFYAAIVWACWVSARSLLRGDAIAEIRREELP